MGLKKMLAQGIEEEKAQLAKASQTSEKPIKEKNVDRTAQVKEDPPVEEPKQKKKSKTTTTKKHPGGRPTNESKGKTSRKQYVLTLIPDDDDKIMGLADEDGLSFSKYIERAVNEYISNHQAE